ncbi:hypothetical protein Rcae01_04996 [Novipirellula caenicola]|uniref:Uncharacterized protein n=1 Tax=Novipirellula caenicola TaxID=1536901 RepID=A0ABP9W046_9BACT
MTYQRRGSACRARFKQVSRTQVTAPKACARRSRTRPGRLRVTAQDATKVLTTSATEFTLPAKPGGSEKEPSASFPGRASRRLSRTLQLNTPATNQQPRSACRARFKHVSKTQSRQPSRVQGVACARPGRLRVAAHGTTKVLTTSATEFTLPASLGGSEKEPSASFPGRASWWLSRTFQRNTPATYQRPRSACRDRFKHVSRTQSRQPSRLQDVACETRPLRRRGSYRNESLDDLLI